MTEKHSTAELVNRWRDGDQDAATELFERYSQELIRIARHHLSDRLASRVDAEDVVQSAFRSLFCRSAQGTIQIERSGDLWRLLVKITVRKVRSQARHCTTAGRDVRREVGREWNEEEIAHFHNGPTHEDSLVFRDLVEATLAELPSVTAEIVAMVFDGYIHEEIAEKLGVTRQTVGRNYKYFKRRLQRELEKDD